MYIKKIYNVYNCTRIHKCIREVNIYIYICVCIWREYQCYSLTEDSGPQTPVTLRLMGLMVKPLTSNFLDVIPLTA